MFDRSVRNRGSFLIAVAAAAGLTVGAGAVRAPKLDFASGSADFGYAYGMIARRQGEGSSHSFVHVWKQENGTWQLLAELLKPVVEPRAQ